MKIYQKIIKCTEYNHICIYLKTELFTGTVPANKNYVTGTVKNGYVPKKMYIDMDPRVVLSKKSITVKNTTPPAVLFLVLKYKPNTIIPRLV